ncbi:hypothetical protein, partial [Salmonella enterica]|uniref:hypothetical protein n=1 Tax=Salmonella enterica TaxID=28901 RepID=UPI00398C4BA3
ASAARGSGRLGLSHAPTVWAVALLGLAQLMAGPVGRLAMVIYRRCGRPAYAKARLEIGKVNSTLQEQVSGMRVVQSHGQQHHLAARLRV